MKDAPLGTRLGIHLSQEEEGGSGHGGELIRETPGQPTCLSSVLPGSGTGAQNVEILMHKKDEGVEATAATFIEVSQSLIRHFQQGHGNSGCSCIPQVASLKSRNRVFNSPHPTKPRRLSPQVSGALSTHLRAPEHSISRMELLGNKPFWEKVYREDPADRNPPRALALGSV